MAHEAKTRGNENVSEANQSLVVEYCEYLDQSVHAPLPVPVDFERELLIRDLSVVEDPCRTTNAPTTACDPGTIGVWTFGHLIREMAGNTPPHQFVAEWLDTFENPQSVNGFPVPPRGNIRTTIIDPWLVASGCNAGDAIVGPGACKLDLDVAPLRFLAVANRQDLAGPSYGAESPGEARFVFGFIRMDTAGGGYKGDKLGGDEPKGPIEIAPPEEAAALIAEANAAAATAAKIKPIKAGRRDKAGQLLGETLGATVILEYRIPPNQKLVSWAERWHELSNLSFGDPEYNIQLQKLTDDFTKQGVDPSRPNLGSSISQIRTNEIDLGLDGMWELREFTLQDVNGNFDEFGLRNTTTKQTPDDSMNGTGALDSYMLADEPLIMDVDHSVPDKYMGGISRSIGFVWGTTVTPPMNDLARHHFAFSTCNGCHQNATNTKFLHIEPRALGTVAPLSRFMAVDPSPSPALDGTPLTRRNNPDDMFPFINREYNEPNRRVCEANRILRNFPDPYTRQNGGVH